jgi:hypothetical protein
MALFSSLAGAAIDGDAGMRALRCRGPPLLGLWVVGPPSGAVFKAGGGIHTNWRLPDRVFTGSSGEDMRSQTITRCAASTIDRVNSNWRRFSTTVLQFIYVLMSRYSLEGLRTWTHRKVPHRIEFQVRRAQQPGLTLLQLRH